MVNDDTETCVMCHVETKYLKTDHIQNRFGYIEGAGQLCLKCYQLQIEEQESYENAEWID